MSARWPALCQRRRAVEPLEALLARLLLLARAALLGVGLAAGAPARLDVPAAVPRCLERRLRLVWAMSAYKPSVSRSGAGAGSKPGIGTSAGKPSNAAAGARPTSSAAATGACARDRRDDVGQRRARAGPRRWSRPARSPRRPARARAPARPGRPSGPPSRMRGGDPPRVVHARGRRQLEVERDQRRARGDERRAARRMRARAGRSPDAALPPRSRSPSASGAAAPQLRARAPAGERAVEEHRQVELAAEQVAEHERLGARGAARASASRWTTGATSSAPTCGCTPSCARDVDALPAPRARRRARRAREPPGAPASVNTERWWSGSAWTSSTPGAAGGEARRRSPSSAAASRPSETLGTARSVVTPRATRRPGVEDGVPPDVERRVEHDDVEVDRDGDGPADPGARSERHVHGAEDLLVLEHVAGQGRAVVRADAQLGEVHPGVAVGAQRVEQPLALRAGRLRQPPVADGEPRGLGRQPDRRERGGDTVPSPPAGAMKPSPQGRLPKAPGAERSPSSEMPSRPRRSSRRSEPRGQVRCASSASLEQLARPPRCAPAARRSRPPSRARACRS